MPFDNDGVITWELMVERMNSELANTLGNLVNRTISMSNKYFGGVVENKGVTEPVDDDLKNFILSVPAKVDAKMEKLRVADAITEVFTIFKRCNKYIDETMHGHLQRTSPNRIVLQPFFTIWLRAFALEPLFLSPLCRTQQRESLVS